MRGAATVGASVAVLRPLRNCAEHLAVGLPGGVTPCAGKRHTQAGKRHSPEETTILTQQPPAATAEEATILTQQPSAATAEDNNFDSAAACSHRGGDNNFDSAAACSPKFWLGCCNRCGLRRCGGIAVRYLCRLHGVRAAISNGGGARQRLIGRRAALYGGGGDGHSNGEI